MSSSTTYNFRALQSLTLYAIWISVISFEVQARLLAVATYEVPSCSSRKDDVFTDVKPQSMMIDAMSKTSDYGHLDDATIFAVAGKDVKVLVMVIEKWVNNISLSSFFVSVALTSLGKVLTTH